MAHPVHSQHTVIYFFINFLEDNFSQVMCLCTEHFMGIIRNKPQLYWVSIFQTFSNSGNLIFFFLIHLLSPALFILFIINPSLLKFELQKCTHVYFKRSSFHFLNKGKKGQLNSSSQYMNVRLWKEIMHNRLISAFGLPHTALICSYFADSVNECVAVSIRETGAFSTGQIKFKYLSVM